MQVNSSGLSEGQYLINDNGHINQRSQAYINLSKQYVPEKKVQVTVGPGHYNPVISDFEKVIKSSPSS